MSCSALAGGGVVPPRPMRGDGGRIADAVPARQAPAKITRDSKSRGRRAGDRRDLESLPIFSHGCDAGGGMV